LVKFGSARLTFEGPQWLTLNENYWYLFTGSDRTA
jgi:hypothetical protein